MEEDEAPDCGRADLASPPDAVPGRLPCGSRHWNGSDPTSRRDKGDADPSFRADFGRGGKGGAISAGGEGVDLAALRLETDLGLVNLCQRDGVGVDGTGATGRYFVTGPFSLFRAPCGVVVGLARGLFGTGELETADEFHFRIFGSMGERGWILGVTPLVRAITEDPINGPPIDVGGVNGLSLACTFNVFKLVP